MVAEGRKKLKVVQKVLKTGLIENLINPLLELLQDLSIQNHTNINQLHNFSQAKKYLAQTI